MRLRNWIAVVVSVVLLMAVGVVGVLVNRSALRAADTVHRADTEALAVNNATLAGQMQLLAAKELAAFAAGHSFDLGVGNPQDQATIEGYVGESSLFTYGAVITTLEGKVLSATRANALPASTDPGYQVLRTLLKAGEPAFSPVMTATDTAGVPVAVQAVAVPLVKNGVPAAVLAGFSRLTSTTLQAYTARLKSSAHLTTIVDSTGTVGFSSEAGVVGTRVDPAIIEAVASHPSGSTFVEYSAGGTPQVAVVVTGDLLPGGWSYARIQSQASFDGAVHSRSQTINLALLAMLLIGAVGISILGYRTQVQRRRADERFQALFQHAPDMVAVLDAEGQVAYSSPSAASVLHFPPGSLQGSNVFDLVHPDDRARMEEAFASLRGRRAGVLRLQTRILNSAGVPTWFDFTASNQMHNPALTGIVINARDISETRAFQERLAHEAQHDPLTGLPNRRRMQDALDTSLRQTAVAVLFVDLDGFKPVNDSYGHEAGDDLLRQVATRLSGCVRGEDLLARVGGDEFVVLMPGITDPHDAQAMNARVTAALEHPFRVLGHDVRIGASVGVHLAGAAADPDQALRAADHAMYAAKRRTPARPAPAALASSAAPAPSAALAASSALISSAVPAPLALSPAPAIPGPPAAPAALAISAAPAAHDAFANSTAPAFSGARASYDVSAAHDVPAGYDVPAVFDAPATYDAFAAHAVPAAHASPAYDVHAAYDAHALSAAPAISATSLASAAPALPNASLHFAAPVMPGASVESAAPAMAGAAEPATPAAPAGSDWHAIPGAPADFAAPAFLPEPEAAVGSAAPGGFPTPESYGSSWDPAAPVAVAAAALTAAAEPPLGPTPVAAAVTAAAEPSFEPVSVTAAVTVGAEPFYGPMPVAAAVTVGVEPSYGLVPVAAGVTVGAELSYGPMPVGGAAVVGDEPSFGPAAFAGGGRDFPGAQASMQAVPIVFAQLPADSVSPEGFARGAGAAPASGADVFGRGTVAGVPAGGGAFTPGVVTVPYSVATAIEAGSYAPAGMFGPEPSARELAAAGSSGAAPGASGANAPSGRHRAAD